jgi:glycosyltransferase involved in cell wall biosynthesis
MNFFLNLIKFIFIIGFSLSVDILGPVMQADGVGQISIGIFEAIKNIKKTSVFPNVYSLENISNELETNILENLDKKCNSDVLFFTNVAHGYYGLENIINNYRLKICCSLFETNLLPDLWVKALNNFDLIIVNSSWLIDVYHKSGVNVPIYNLNIPLPVSDLVRKDLHKSSEKFVFGMTAGPWGRKNHIKLIEAFNKTFKDNNNVSLKIHIRKFHELLSINSQDSYVWRHVINYCKDIKNLVSNLPNVEIIGDVLLRNDYLEFISSCDCLVLPSSGEGFSISPRESLALGVPVIISKNTSHLDLAKNPGVLFIPSGKEIPAIADFDDFKFGMQYDINEEDISACLKEMYNNYDFYSQEAQKNSIDNLKLSYASLSNDYLTLIEPKQIIISDKNLIDPINKILYTNNKNLLNKYNSFLNNNSIIDNTDNTLKSMNSNFFQEKDNTVLMQTFAVE